MGFLPDRGNGFQRPLPLAARTGLEFGGAPLEAAAPSTDPGDPVTTPGHPTTGAEVPGDPRVAVVLASAGRPELLGEVVDALAEQTWRDFTLVLSVPDARSLPARVPPVAVVVHDRGLPAQRNKGLDAVPDATHVFFFDDDAVLREDYLERGMAFFAQHPEVVALTGRVLLDGATGDAVPADEARAALDASHADPLTGGSGPEGVQPTTGSAIPR